MIYVYSLITFMLNCIISYKFSIMKNLIQNQYSFLCLIYFSISLIMTTMYLNYHKNQKIICLLPIFGILSSSITFCVANDRLVFFVVPSLCHVFGFICGVSIDKMWKETFTTCGQRVR
jgi:hypothetical protein